MNLNKQLSFIALILFLISCTKEPMINFTGNEITIPMIAGEVNGNTTSGILTIKERIDGAAQVEIIIQNVLTNAIHPVHLHYGSLDDNGNIARMLEDVIEVNGTGKSITVIGELGDGTPITYQELLLMDGSIKVHFEASGPLEKELIASANIGINQEENAAYLEGVKEIKVCNSLF